MELGDHSTVRCEKTGLVAEIEFKTKGFIGGKYDQIHGMIKNERTGDKLFEIEGKWNQKMTIKDLKTKKTSTFFDATDAKETLVTTKDISSMAPRESRRLWHETTEAIKARDQTTATNAKSLIEDAQRDEAKARTERGEHWEPKFFKQIGPEDYVFKGSKELSGAELSKAMEEMVGGITSAQTKTSEPASTTTTSAPQAQPAPSATTTKEDPQPQIGRDDRPPAPMPRAVPVAETSTERPTLQPVDSENQTFHDAQEDFDRLSIAGQ